MRELPEPSLPQAARAPLRWTGSTRPRRAGVWLAGLLALLLLAAWAIPPLLDWGRFRTAIAAIAAARLGRPVTIAGDISLRLLPQAVLTATDVTLPDQGDGISGQIAALRLQVATLPLLRGRIMLRDLVLGAPTLRLPWGLPDTITHPTRPLVPPGFAARMENGVLRIGQTEISGITASLHGGPDTTSGVAAGVQEALAPDTTPAAGFGAEGFAAAAGRIWRFTASLGAPNADGISAVDIGVQGQGAAGNTGGSLQGTLSDGMVQGTLRAGGPNLALLLPAAPLAWRAEAPFAASGPRIELGGKTSGIALSLGSAQADGAMVLRLGAQARLDGRLHAAALDLDADLNAWVTLLAKNLPAGNRTAPTTMLPLQVNLSADTVALLGGTLHNVHATLVSDAGRIGLDHLAASLPGDARLTADHMRLAAGIQTAWLADGRLDAPHLRETLAWLQKLAPSLLDAPPDGTLQHATLTGQLRLAANTLAVTALSGTLDDSAVNGSFGIAPGPRPRLDATLDIAPLMLDPWLAGLAADQTLAAAGTRLAQTDTRLHIRAAHAGWHGQTLTNLALDGSTGEAGLTLDQAQATLAGATLSLSGTLGRDGSLTAARLSATVPDLARILPLLPTAWRNAAPATASGGSPGAGNGGLSPGAASGGLSPEAGNGGLSPEAGNGGLSQAPAWSSLWQGPGDLRATASGPPDALALQVRADAGDLVLEAESLRNTGTGGGTATITLRHPGAPRLLAALGLPGGLDAAIRWLDTGSLALRAHLLTTPQHLAVQDFDLAAASLQIGGHANLDWSGPTPVLTGTLTGERLALPGWPDRPHRWLALAAAWDTSLHLATRHLTIAQRPVAENLSLDLAAQAGGVLATGIQATALGGRLTGEMAADLGQPAFAARLTLNGFQLPPTPANWPITLLAGAADVSAELSAGAIGWSSLAGQAHATLAAVQIRGMDLAPLSHPVTRATPHPRDARAADQALSTGSSTGSSAGLSGTLDAAVANGRITLAPARLASMDGSLTLSGTGNLAANTIDLHLTPAAGSGVRLSGPWQAPKALADPVPVHPAVLPKHRRRH